MRVVTCFSRLKIVALLGAALLAMVGPASAQGMVTTPSQAADLKELGLEGLKSATPQEVATIQRLLRRLGYLKDENMTRELDDDTLDALGVHLAAVGGNLRGRDTAAVMHSLFTTAWVKEGWGTGTVAGQDLVVDKAEVSQAQQTLLQLKYAPGPVDGIFGPATFSAVEIFQEDNGLKVNGLLTRNTFLNVTLAATFADRKPKGVVRVLNWPDYISPAELENFQKQTDLRVVHEIFESSSETKDLLQQGSDKYDLMVQNGAQMRQVLETKDSVEALDRAKLPNAQYLDPTALKFTDVLDPGNSHSVPYMWGTVGLGVNKTKVRAIRPDAPLDSVALILDPAIAADLSQCGIAIINEPIDALPPLAAYLGSDLNSMGITDLETVEKALSKVAPFIKVVGIDTYIDSLAEGKYCVVLGYSGDVFQAREAAREKGTGEIVYSVPKNGTQLWIDLVLIPNKARNKDGAYQLLNHLLKPEVAAANTNYIQYANPVLASAAFIEPKLLNDPGLYPPESVFKRLVVQPPMPVDMETELNRIWSKLSKE